MVWSAGTAETSPLGLGEDGDLRSAHLRPPHDSLFFAWVEGDEQFVLFTAASFIFGNITDETTPHLVRFTELLQIRKEPIADIHHGTNESGGSFKERFA